MCDANDIKYSHKDIKFGEGEGTCKGSSLRVLKSILRFEANYTKV